MRCLHVKETTNAVRNLQFKDFLHYLILIARNKNRHQTQFGLQYNIGWKTRTLLIRHWRVWKFLPIRNICGSTVEKMNATIKHIIRHVCVHMMICQFQLLVVVINYNYLRCRRQKLMLPVRFGTSHYGYLRKMCQRLFDHAKHLKLRHLQTGQRVVTHINGHAL